MLPTLPIIYRSACSAVQQACSVQCAAQHHRTATSLLTYLGLGWLIFSGYLTPRQHPLSSSFFFFRIYLSV